MRVLNLGAGVQSTRIYLEMCDGTIEPADVAIFSDTGDEPKAVYRHLEMLESLSGPPIVRVSNGNLGDNLIDGVNTTGQRFVSIPSFLSVDGEKNTGIGRRQCTKEYKIIPIERKIRGIAGSAKGRPLPKGVVVVQVFGLSFDEPKRVARVSDIYRGREQWKCEFPLFEDFVTRADCVNWLQRRLPGYVVPRSACVFCPYKSDEEWLFLKATDPEGWARAVQIDNAIRLETSACAKGLDAKQYLHRSCKPLELVQLNPRKPDPQRVFQWSEMDCEGMCGL